MRPFDIVALSPAGLTDPAIAVAASRAGGIGLLDIDSSTDVARATSDIERMLRFAKQRVGIRFGDVAGEVLTRIALQFPDSLTDIIVSSVAVEADLQLLRSIQSPNRRLWLEVTSVDEAMLYGEINAFAGLIAKGNEAGGWVGEETTFVLLQRLLRATSFPVIAWGGIGLHSAASCYAAGAAGVVLDLQLALASESVLPQAVKTAIASMDGSETVCDSSPDGRLFRALSRAKARPGDKRTSWDSSPEAVWPIGQDAAFARGLSEKYRTTGGVIAAVRESVAQHVQTAARLRPLGPDASLARSHGTRYPIVQGAMTRVSDRAEFALAVAEGGALPFIALALMRAAEVEALLDETRRLLGDRPWGVGVLGFVPPELREEQLGLVRRFRPPFALIAGGRPDQAHSLEQDGIATYLHVPSPGLLRMFVQEGARRFVFEGRECGGHVGPRSSFVLWNTMVEVLLESAQASELEQCHVLFAGGVHDALSASMVAALAAPLAERGAKVGVLLGTAYLFTVEAVTTGAIVETFQQTSLGCARTVLLESSPGHAIRCVANEYAGEFEEEKRRLSVEGKSRDDIRDALDSFTTGRLRLASKGIIRASPEEAAGHSRFVEVGRDRALTEGMYMVGQIAAMRDTVTTIAELHRDVAETGTELLVEVASRFDNTAQQQKQRPSAVAIVGMSCMLPGAPDLEMYWRILLANRSVIGEVPVDRWDSADYFDSDRGKRDRAYSRWGGFIDATPFDPLEFGMPPNSLRSIEPLHLLTLLATREALKDAGYASRAFDRSRTSTIIAMSGGLGTLGGAYMARAALPNMFGGATSDKLLDESAGFYPEWTEDSFAGLLPNVTAGRIANRFDFGGMNSVVDAACGSSLAAIHAAVRELESRTTDMVIAGGADNTNTAFSFVAFSKTNALSPTGACRTFDASADGIAISEGIVMLVLKRVEDAERDGDRIYAVIRGSGASSDGKAKGLTAPRSEGQTLALRRAYAAAGFSPATVGLIEAHGTGTVVGDRTEVQALTSFLNEAGATSSSVAIGSAKSVIGHTKATAGMAGIAKAALALHHKVLPPTAGVTRPNPDAGFGQGPLYVNSEARPWIQSDARTPRRAGVSAFGFGGTNFHAVLEEYAAMSPGAPGGDEWTAELFLWAAAGPADLRRQIATLADQLTAGAALSLRDLAFTVCSEIAGRRTPGCLQLAIVAKSSDDLVLKMRTAETALASGEHINEMAGVFCGRAAAEVAKSIAFLFPGQGSQYPDMLRDLAMRFDPMRETIERFDDLLAGCFPEPLSRYAYPPPAFTEGTKREQRLALTDTRVAQPALGAADLGLFKTLAGLDVIPAMVAGHSYGEYVALCAAGVMDEITLARLSEARGRAIAECSAGNPGTMAAVGGGHKDVGGIIAPLDNVWIANVNSPRQTIIAGTPEGVESACALLAKGGFSTTPIPVSCAFHSPLVAPAGARLSTALDAVDFRDSRIPVYSNTSATPFPCSADEIAKLLSNHLVKPVQFFGEIEAMYEAGARIFVEVGPRSVLTGLVTQILGDRPFDAIAIDSPATDGLTAFLNALAQLAVRGVPMNTDALFRGRGATRLNLGRLESGKGDGARSPTTWMVDPAQAWPASDLRPRHKSDALRSWAVQGSESSSTGRFGAIQTANPVNAAETARTASAVTPSDEVMLEFQRVMTRALEVQKSVMLAYLGAEGRDDALMAEQGLSAFESAVEAAAVNDIPAQPLSTFPMSGSSATTPITSLQRISGEAVLAELTRIVSERTGYPPDVLGLDIDLEGELGVDSIKRTEIVGAMRKLALGDGHQTRAMDQLARAKTIRAIADTLVRLASEPAEAVDVISVDTVAKPLPSVLIDDARHLAAGATRYGNPAGAAAGELNRTVLEVVYSPLEEVRPSIPAGLVCVITDDERGVAASLAERINAAGGKAVVMRDTRFGSAFVENACQVDLSSPESVHAGFESIVEEHGAVGALIHLVPLRDPAPSKLEVKAWRARCSIEVKGLFNLLKAAGSDLRKTAGRDHTGIIAAAAMGGDWALGGRASDLGHCTFFPGHGGIAGLIKTVAREWTEVPTRAVDFDSHYSVEEIASALYDELCAPASPVQVGYTGGRRFAARQVNAPLTSGHPTLNGQAEAAIPRVGSQSVVLVTGGARGITAEVSIAIAAQSAGSTWILVGRSPVPEELEAEPTRGLEKPEELRGHFLNAARAGGAAIALVEIESGIRRLIQDREIRKNLARFADAGAAVRYVQADVTDAGAIASLIGDIRAEFGHLDGVIHGAGTIDDRLIDSKSLESFDSVFDPKVNGAFALAESLDGSPPSFVIFFSSTAAAFGNKGQCDYAAANEVLNKLAQYLSGRWGSRVTAIGWGPWEGSGMVSPQLRRSLLASGIPMVNIAQGVAAFENELCCGSIDSTQVIYAGDSSSADRSATVGRTGREAASVT